MSAKKKAVPESKRIHVFLSSEAAGDLAALAAKCPRMTASSTIAGALRCFRTMIEAGAAAESGEVIAKIADRADRRRPRRGH